MRFRTNTHALAWGSDRIRAAAQFRRQRMLVFPSRPMLVLTLSLVAVTTLPAQTPEQMQQLTAALPSEPAAKPTQARKLLVFTLTRGFRHDSIAIGVAAMRMLGEKTKAFSVTHSEDPAVFE